MKVENTLKSSDTSVRRKSKSREAKAAINAMDIKSDADNGPSILSTTYEPDLVVSLATHPSRPVRTVNGGQGSAGAREIFNSGGESSGAAPERHRIRELSAGSSSTDVETRIDLLERRLQLLSGEFRTALSLIPPSVAGDSGKAATARRLAGNISFDADSLSQFAVGFYPREYSSSGTPFRWTGSGPFCELRLFVDRTVDREFAIDVGDTDESVLFALGGFVDYAPVALSIEKGPQGHLVTGLLPKRAYTRLAVITIALGKSPSTDNGSKEDWLGFRFYSMKVRPADGSDL